MPLPPADRQCTHNKSDGTRCEAWSVKGLQVCIYHGGAAPVTKAAGRLRLLAMADVAFRTLLEAMDPANGAGWKEKITAAVAVLDRSGFGPKSTVVVDQPDTRDYSEMTLEQLEQEALKTADQIRAARTGITAEQFADLKIPGLPS